MGVVDGGFQVEYLEDPFETDHGGHQVDSQVAQLRQGPVETRQERHHGGEGTEAESSLDDGATTDSVKQGGGKGPQQGQRGQEDAHHHRHPHPVAGQLPGLVLEHPGLAARVAEKFHQHRPGDGEAFRHHVGQFRLMIHPQARQAGGASRHQFRGHHEHGKQHQGRQGQLPRQHQHRPHDEKQCGGAAQGLRERRRERLLRTRDVPGDAGDDPARVGAGEEGQRHGADAVEQLTSQSMGQALPDPGRTPAFQQRQQRTGQRQPGDEQRQLHDEVRVARQHPVVDDALEQQHREHGGCAAQQHRHGEDDEPDRERSRLQEYPTGRTAREVVLQHRVVAGEGTQHRPVTTAHSQSVQRSHAKRVNPFTDSVSMPRPSRPRNGHKRGSCDATDQDP